MTKGSDVSGETPTLLGPIERSNLNHWTTHVSITTADTERSFDAFVLRCRSADTERDFGAFVSLSTLPTEATRSFCVNKAVLWKTVEAIGTVILKNVRRLIMPTKD
jgi:hypothetical protein